MSYFSNAKTIYTDPNPFGSKRSKPERPNQPKQEPISNKKAGFYFKETPYIFQKNKFTGPNGDRFIIVIGGCGFPKGTIGILSDIKPDYATFTDVRTGKAARISVLAGMGLKDYKEIKQKVKDGIISFTYNKTYGNEKLTIVEKCLD